MANTAKITTRWLLALFKTRSAIPMLEAMGISHDGMKVRVTVGVQNPVAVDYQASKTALPRGRAWVMATRGGLNLTHPDRCKILIIASAAFEAFSPKQD